MLSNVSALKRNSKAGLPTKRSSSSTTNTVKQFPQTQLPKQTKGTPLGKDSATKKSPLAFGNIILLNSHHKPLISNKHLQHLLKPMVESQPQQV